MVWDASQQKYAFVNPDEVLSVASDDTTVVSPGLPQDFVDEIVDEVEVSDIDLDAGTF